MNFKELNSLIALTDNGFNVSEAAKKLFIVQSAVSQHISRLEQEIGLQIVVRKGKRILGLTSDGEVLLDNARQAIAIRNNIMSLGRDNTDSEYGEFRIGATHAQVCYVLPRILHEFKRIYPDIKLVIYQDTPDRLLAMVQNHTLDLSISSFFHQSNTRLAGIPIYRWSRAVVAPRGHPILEKSPISLEDICLYPVITYSLTSGRNDRLLEYFARSGHQPNIVVNAVDSDVIKRYVRAGYGVGLISSIAYSKDEDGDLGIMCIKRLLPYETTWITYHKDKCLRNYHSEFIRLVESMVSDEGIVSCD